MTIKTFNKHVNEANAAVVQRANEIVGELTQLRQTVEELELGAIEADTKPDQIKAAWFNGDESISALALQEAEAMAIRAQTLHEGAVARFNALNASYPNTDDTLAQVIAAALNRENALPGLPAIPSATHLTTEPQISELPLILVVQKTAAEQRQDGSLSGKLDLVYFHNPRIHKDIDPSVIDDACQQSLYRVKAQSRGAKQADGYDVKRFALTVDYAWADTPQVSQSAHAIGSSTFANGLAQHLATGGSRSNTVRQTTDGDRLIYSGSICKAKLAERETFTSTIVDGKRVNELSATILVSNTAAGVGSVDRLKVLITQDYEPGMFFSGLGVLDEITVTPKQDMSSGINRQSMEVVAKFRAAV